VKPAKHTSISFLLTAAILVVGGATTSAEAQPKNSEKTTEPSLKTKLPFNPRNLMKPFRAIVNAPFITADEVTDQVTDNELVLGVVVNGAARAYPINMLTGPRREIINDTLGGQHIAATW